MCLLNMINGKLWWLKELFLIKKLFMFQEWGNIFFDIDKFIMDQIQAIFQFMMKGQLMSLALKAIWINLQAKIFLRISI